MLVLTRREGEEILVGNDVVVRIATIKGDRVRVAIDAPTSIAVHRREIYEAIVAQRAEAAKVGLAGKGPRP